MKYSLPPLPYPYDGLEPYIDARTMEIHHTKHHQGYVDKLNAVLEKYPDLQEKPLEDLLKGLDALKIDEKDKTAIKNHGGGHLNHSLFWQIMGPTKESNQSLVTEIEKEFGSVDEFKKQFTEIAATLFGSGWAWLARDENGKLHLHGMPNQDSPYLHGHTPIIGLDIWEHAYYLKYQNRRPEYIEAWWNVLKLI
ncbi:MAG: superoxide dismutase [Candidatus Colwellbacteria bacterium]|nr:superoxide dismutase [Candidatus Colwellbacteria bacterium]